jgi:GDP-L-fucose synthase
MIRKFHEAKENDHSDVILWGSGTPLREFLHVDDLAQAVKYVLENPTENSLYNVGTGKDITIANLAVMIQSITGNRGAIRWDKSKPDGTQRKLMDSSKLQSLGWLPKINLRDGIRSTYNFFKDNL